MFKKISVMTDVIVAHVTTIRDNRNEIKADKIMAKDPCADETYTYVEGAPVSFREFNRGLRKAFRENR